MSREQLREKTAVYSSDNRISLSSSDLSKSRPLLRDMKVLDYDDISAHHSKPAGHNQSAQKSEHASQNAHCGSRERGLEGFLS
jgi:hypothetical protein